MVLIHHFETVAKAFQQRAEEQEQTRWGTIY